MKPSGAASVIASVLAAIMAAGLLGPIGGLVVAWLLLSPDAVASTTRGGGAGAVAAGAAAASDYLRDEWAAGAPNRQRLRTARRDRWHAAGGWRARALSFEHALVITGRVLRTAWTAIGKAAAVMPAGARAGIAATQDQRGRSPRGPARHGPNRPDSAQPDPAGGPPAGRPANGSPGPDPARPDPADPGDPGDPGDAGIPSDPGGLPAAGSPSTPSGDDMTQTTSTGPVGSGELETTADLRAEAQQIAALIEEAEVLAGVLRDWQTGLDDRYLAGEVKTRALNDAVIEVGEAGGDAAALGEALGAIRRACDEADALGEEASSIGASGHTSGYVPA